MIAKFMGENLVTYKLKYDCSENFAVVIDKYIKGYNNLLRCTYNFLFKHGQKNLKEYQKSLKNVCMESVLRTSATCEARKLLKQDIKRHEKINKQRKETNLFPRKRIRKSCFGGIKFLNQYTHNNIDKQQWHEKRTLPLFSIGEKGYCGNRYFSLHGNVITFKPNKNIIVNLNFTVKGQRKKDLQKLEELQNLKVIPITYRLDTEYIYITFDLNKVREIKPYKPIENRVFAIDMNPNYIGYSVVQWNGEIDYKVIDSGVVSIKELNDYENSLKGLGLSQESKERQYISHKRTYEITKIIQRLVTICKHYQCEVFGIEDITISSHNHEKGKGFNRLVNNQWNRLKLNNLLQKYCKLFNIRLVPVLAQYSSFIGNLGYRQEHLPDMVLASIEIGRRAKEFLCQYVKKNQIQKRNIIFPDIKLYQTQIIHAMEEIGYIVEFKNWIDLYTLMKNAKVKYRVLLSSVEQGVFSLLSTRSMVKIYSYNQ